MTGTKTITKLFAANLLVALTVLPASGSADSLLAGYTLDAGSMQQWRLPGRLNEISGLALTADDRLFAIADEEAAIYEIDADKGKLKKAFAFGDPVLRDDFEGIAIIGEVFYLITSDGVVISGREGADGEQLPYQTQATGIGRHCEIEGLAADIDGHLLIACKEWRRGGKSRNPVIFRWSVTEQRLLDEFTIELQLSEILPRVDANRLNPSGIMVDPASGNMLLVAARQRVLLELDSSGRLLGALRLPLASRHRQPEGIERLSDGRLLIADEGGNHKARLAVYLPMSQGVSAAQ